MVGLVLISHSSKVADGAKELVSQMASDVKIVSAGGTSDGRLGTDAEKIANAIREVYSKDGVIVLFDLGSAYMNAEMALEFLDDDMRENVKIIDAALVEGALIAGVDASIGKSIEEIEKSLKPMALGKIS